MVSRWGKVDKKSITSLYKDSDELEEKYSIDSALFLYNSSLPTPLQILSSPIPINCPPIYNNMD